MLRKMKSALTRLEKQVSFFRGFLEHPQQVGSVISSSAFLERRIITAGQVGSAKTVVELGCGTGGTTRAILDAMPADGRLLSIEINQQFYAMIEGIEDARLVAHHGSAEALAEVLDRYSLPAPEAIISGIPFSTMDERTALGILEAIELALAPGGRFVAYQVRGHVHTLGRRFFGPAQVELEPLNIPPARVFKWEKTALQEASADQ